MFHVSQRFKISQPLNHDRSDQSFTVSVFQGGAAAEPQVRRNRSKVQVSTREDVESVRHGGRSAESFSKGTWGL